MELLQENEKPQNLFSRVCLASSFGKPYTLKRARKGFGRFFTTGRSILEGNLRMRMERLELSRNFSLDSKSSASTNYATSAFVFLY
jgi:hypothetical protein